MDKIEVYIGSVQASSSGMTLDTTKKVEFTGERIASYNEPGTHKGNVSDTRGINQTLYKTSNGRLIAHIEDWSHWQGEPSTYSLIEVTAADLEPGGQFERLGDVAGYGRALTLDEALAPVADCIVTDPAELAA